MAVNPSKPKGDSQATRLVLLARDRYRFAQADDGRAFAVPLDGPPIARPLDGTRSSLRSELAAAYFQATGQAAGKSALADALGVLDGWAAMAEREPLHLRYGRHHGKIVMTWAPPTASASSSPPAPPRSPTCPRSSSAAPS